MSRGGNKIEVVVKICTVCKTQTGHGYINTANHGKKIEFKRYCPTCQKHTEQYTKLESAGSKGLARNK